MKSLVHRHIKRFTPGRKLTRKLNDENLMTALARSQNPMHQFKFKSKTQKVMHALKRLIEIQANNESRLVVPDCQAVEGVIIDHKVKDNQQQLDKTT